MGLHLNYELRVPADTPRGDVARMLRALRELAASQSVDRVSPLADLSARAFGAPDDASQWLRFCAECLAHPLHDDELPDYTGDPSSAIGFLVDPGEGSETATFGLMRRRADVGGEEEWFWWCACKTQYASLVSEAHLIAVHTTLIAILDAAVRLGFDVVVQDETEYWDTRSTETLVESVRKMNCLIARFAGALSDAIGDEHDLVAPIFDHREFERLEMEGGDEWS